MGEQTALKRGGSRSEGDAGSSLEALSRTLEALEARLAGAIRPRQPPIDTFVLPAEPAAAAPARPSLSEAVSQIVMRRQMLDGVGAPEPRAPARSFAAEVDEIRREDASLGAAAGIAEELRELRGEIQAQRAVLRPSDMRLDTLRQGYDGLREAVVGPSVPSSAQREIAVLEAALAELAAEGADETTISALRTELSGIRDIVSAPVSAPAVPPAPATGRPVDEKRSVPQELERLRASFGGDPAARAAATEERLSSLLTSEMNQLREKIETLASERSLRAVEERWQAMEGRFASRDIEATITAMAERMAQLETALARLPETLPIGTLQARIESLAAAVDAALLQPQPEPDDAPFVALEERLDEIARAIVAVGQRPAPTLDMGPIERIETRMSALSSRLDALTDSVGAGELSERVEEIALRLDAMAAEDRSALLAERLERFGEAMQRLLSEQEQARAGSAAIEERLSSLSERLDREIAERVDPALARSLEEQIARLSIQLSTVGGLGTASGVVDEQVDERLSAIERRLDENRDAVISTARAAADEAVARLMEAGERRQSEHVAQLSDALRSLEALSVQNDKRMAGVVDAVHETLLKIVERLDQIEDEMSGAMRPAEAQAPFVLAHPPETARAAETPVALAAEEEPAAGGLMGAFSRRFSSMRNASASEIIAAAPAPEVLRDPIGPAAADEDEEPLSPAEANRPLDIGSGTPDIAALISRVRAQQRAADAAETAPEAAGGKADFIAAARRHAMAAAAEVDSLRSDEQLSRLGYGRLGDVVSRRRKPILMAVGAVLLALMAMPLGVKLIRDLSTAPAGERIAEVAAEAEGQAVAEIAPPATPDAPVAEAPAPAETVVAAAEPEAPAAPAAELMQPAASRPADVAAPGFDLTEGPDAEAPAPAETAPAVPARAAETAAVAQPAEPAAPKGPDLAALAAAPLPAMPEAVGPTPLTAAAQNGNPVAMFEIGLRLMEGTTGEPKPAEAVRWFEQAAGRGFAPAQYSLGTLFEKGNGVSRDTVAARDWYTLAADQGNVRAMHNLAVLYATGVDGVSQPETAAKWFTQAADFGMRDSQYNLGILYARGAGVPQDMVQSYKWFAIVAASGDKDAADKRDEVRQSLSPEQRTQAEAAVAAWSPKSRVESANTVDVPQEWSERSADTTASVDMTRAVRNIQIILGKLGYDAGAPDGKVGARTTEAIRSFQSDTGLEATGEIDETLIRALLARKDA